MVSDAFKHIPRCLTLRDSMSNPHCSNYLRNLRLYRRILFYFTILLCSSCFRNAIETISISGISKVNQLTRYSYL